MLLLNVESELEEQLEAGRSIKTLLKSSSLEIFMSWNSGVAVKRVELRL